MGSGSTSTLTLSSANNSFSGSAQINAGTLNVTNGAALGSNSSVTVGGSGTLQVNGVTLSGPSAINVGGVVEGSGANATVAAPITLVTGGSFGGSGSLAVTSQISGSADLVVNGSGNTLILNNTTSSNNYTGATTITNGTLQLATASQAQIPSTSPLSVGANGTFNLNNFNASVGSLTGSGVISLGSGTLTTTETTAGTYSGTLSGSGGLALGSSSTAQLTLNNNNIASGFTGNTAINGGTLSILNGAALGNGGTVNVASGGTLDIDASNLSGPSNVNLTGTLTGTTSFASIAVPITLASGGTFGGTGTLTVTSQISGSGGLNVNGTGTLKLDNISSANSYSGATTITNGTLLLGTATQAQIPTTTSLVVGSGGNFNLNNFNATVGSLSGVSGGVINLGTATLTSNETTPTTFAGSLSGSGGFILGASSTNTLTLSNANTYLGTTQVNGGTLNATNANALSSGAVSVASTGSLEITNISIANSVTVNGGTLLGSGNATFAGAISLGANSNINNGAGTLALNGGINGPAALSLSGSGATMLNSAINVKSLTSNAGNTVIGTTVTSTNDQVFNDPVNLSSASTLKSTSGSINLANTVDGASDLTLNSAGSTTLGGQIGGNVALNSLTANSNTIMSGGLVNTTGNQTYNSGVTLTANATLNSANAITLNNGVTGAGQNLTLTGGNNFVVAGNIGVNNISVTGGNGTNNSLQVASPNSQTWSLNGSGVGAVAGTGQAGTFSFNQIQNLVGGNNNDTFTLNGGSLAGSITGGSGNSNTLASTSGTTFNLTGANSGTVAGLGNGYSQIQNLTGGNGNNTFVFTNGSSLSGVLNGGTNPASTNNLDYSQYGIITAFFSSQTSGRVVNSGNQSITPSFININNILGNNQGVDVLTTAPAVTNMVHVTAFGTGFINDPTFFAGFSNIFGQGNTQVIFDQPAVQVSQNSFIVNGGVMTFTNVQFGGNIVNTTPASNPVTPISPATTNAVASNVANIVTPFNVQTITSEAALSTLPSALGASQNIDEMVLNQLKIDTVMQQWTAIGCLGN
ncbi:MAG: beta strand repeat-containing protein [Gammaproteobacteria bacterium]